MVGTRALSTIATLLLALCMQSSIASPALMQKRTLEPCSSNTKGKCPATTNCSPAKTSVAIQAAECSHNTRASAPQTFAVFETDHRYDGVPGAPYGTCRAYTCGAPESTVADADCWTFFWAGGPGQERGTGTGCIRSPDDGACGCENSDGTFVPGGDDCS
ncbi:small secreted protein [Xylariomycetidae sp. FL0641]|nr:small secreted protein [Xylariomycetidae sp. FL0641]